ncbi:hypothetical protein KKB55_21865, partial [Myxococcota bacterium]|nr:hypothetical protein [Myxococcota bacterium]
MNTRTLGLLCLALACQPIDGVDEGCDGGNCATPDADSSVIDSDGDGIPDALDDDADGDGVLDAQQGGGGGDIGGGGGDIGGGGGDIGG